MEEQREHNKETEKERQTQNEIKKLKKLQYELR